MSKHEVPVVRIEKILNHNNADSLEIVEVFGYQCIVKKGQFKPGDLACFIEPDYIVPLSRPEFSFLQKPGQMKETKRITTTKLRGQISYGLLVPADKSLKKNEDAMNFLGVVRWQPPASSSKKAEIEKAPRKFGFWGTINFYIFQIKKFFKDRKKRRWSPKNHPSAQLCYDLQNWKRYNEAFEDGENVYITCKIHGSNYRTIFSEGKMCVGSRRVWKNDDGNHWWKVLGKIRG
jgi:RNA ligase (TIGR02306 family)